LLGIADWKVSSNRIRRSRGFDFGMEENGRWHHVRHGFSWGTTDNFSPAWFTIPTRIARPQSL